MTAKAAAIMFNLDTPDEPPMVVGLFEDDGEGMDPRFKAETLWESVEEDWPGWQVAYIANDDADELTKQRRMWSFGMSDDDDEMHARIEAHNAAIDAREKRSMEA